MQSAGVHPGECAPRVAAFARRRESIVHGRAAVDDIVDVVIPAVGIIVRNKNHRVVPLRRLLNGIDYVHQECLLIKRVRVACMAIAIGCRLEVADCWKITGLYRVKEVVDVVLVMSIAIICLPDRLHGGGPRVIGVGG